VNDVPAPPSAAPAEQIPTGRPTLVDARSFVFWVFVGAVGYGLIHTFSAITSAPILQLRPAIGWLALVLWAAYGVVFLWLVYAHQLFVRRSPWITAAALLWGGFVATWFAAQANSAVQDMISRLWGADFNDRWGIAIAAPINEESMKLLGLAVLVLLPLVGLRSTLDGFFYGAMIGVGFQVVEDYVYTIQQSSNLSDTLAFLFTRGLIGGLWSHAVYTGIVGAGVGYLISRRDRPWPMRIGVALGLLLVAVAMHSLWNSPLLNGWAAGPGQQLLVFLLKGLPALLILLFVLRWGRAQERKAWQAFVSGNVDRELVAPAEAEALLDRRGRRAARRAVKTARGRRAGRLQKALQREQLWYVQAVGEEGPDSARAGEAAGRVRELKAALAG
jgi:RsiW-degrading membrane proteinase PrsW (M82 family)